MAAAAAAYLAPSGGRGSCLGLRTGVSPHFSTSSKREMLADHERGAASPPSSPMPDFGAALSLGRDHTQTAPGRRRRTPSLRVGRRRRRTAANFAVAAAGAGAARRTRCRCDGPDVAGR